MSFSMYQITVPVYQRMLTNLDYCLGQAAAFANENGLSEKELMQRRLIDDMFTLSEQILRACEHSAGTAARLAGLAPPDLPSDPDTDITAARARISKSLEFLDTVGEEQMEGDPQRPITVKVRLGEVSWPAQEYVLHFTKAHFYFHVTTAYDILRAEGVNIGKIDYLGAVMKDKFPGRR